MYAMSRTYENTRDKFADTAILVRYKCGYVAWHLTLSHRDLRGADHATEPRFPRGCGVIEFAQAGTRRARCPLCQSVLGEASLEFDDGVHSEHKRVVLRAAIEGRDAIGSPIRDDDVKNLSQIWAVAPALVKLALRDVQQGQTDKEPPWKRIAKGLG